MRMLIRAIRHGRTLAHIGAIFAPNVAVAASTNLQWSFLDPWFNYIVMNFGTNIRKKLNYVLLLILETREVIIGKRDKYNNENFQLFRARANTYFWI